MTPTDLLSPFVVVVIPRFSEAIKVIIQHVLPHYPHCRIVAVSAGQEESNNYARIWNSSTKKQLLLLHERPENQIEALTTTIDIMLNGEHNHPIGIILADSSELAHFESQKRPKWNLALAERLGNSFRDLQIVEYSDSWKYSPPRIR